MVPTGGLETVARGAGAHGQMTATVGDRVEVARVALTASLGPREACECAVIELHIDGLRFGVEFRVDREEHRRRQRLGVGAVTGTGLLHALWELPAGLPIPARCLTEPNLATLRELGEGFVEGTKILTRTFTPAGNVSAVVVVADTISDAISRASRLPPIFWRVAAARRLTADVAESVAFSERTGVGSLVVGSDGSTELVAPRPPVRGVPAVYRWWLSELAYRNWGHGNCAHCVS